MKLSISIVLIGLLFGGCGSSSGPSSDDVKTGTGYYKDSAVEGINYSCGSKSGTTDASGKFTFEKGKNCTFTLAGMTLRAVKASELFDKVEIVEDNATVYTLLQTLDSDANASNGITILPQVVEQLKKVQVTLPASPAEVANVHNEIKNVQGYKGKLKTEDEAKDHVLQTQTEVTKRLLAGKTLYIVDGFRIKRVEINQDATKLTFIDTDGTKNVYNSEIKGNTIVDKYGIHYIDIVIEKYISGHDKRGTWKFYFNKSDAQKALDSATGGSDNSQNATTDLKALLAGKTYYLPVEDSYLKENNETVQNNHVETLTFQNSGVLHIEWIEDGTTHSSDSIQYEINENSVRIHGKSGNGEDIDDSFIFESKDSKGDLFLSKGFKLYLSKSDAENALESL